jgi:hypothetical protein
MAEVYIQIPRKEIVEGAYFNGTAHFRSGDTSAVPTSARWRLDNLTTGRNVTAWTTITPAASATLVVGPNTMEQHCRKNVLMQITVESDTGLTTQDRSTKDYRIVNNRAFND